MKPEKFIRFNANNFIDWLKKQNQLYKDKLNKQIKYNGSSYNLIDLDKIASRIISDFALEQNINLGLTHIRYLDQEFIKSQLEDSYKHLRSASKILTQRYFIIVIDNNSISLEKKRIMRHIHNIVSNDEYLRNIKIFFLFHEFPQYYSIMNKGKWFKIVR